MDIIQCNFRLITFRSVILFTTLLFCSRAAAVDWIYVVSSGDNLWNFSEKYLGSSANWKKVQRINQLPDPNWIRPGTRLRIPLDWLKSNSVPATVTALQGKAYLIKSDGSSDLLAIDAMLSLGDRIQTSVDSSVSIKFADGSIVTLEPNSELGLDHLSAYGDTGMVDSRLRLHKGRLETRVTPASGAGSRFEIYTSSAISTVRGTSYRVAENASSSSSSIEVTGGVVDVIDSAELGKEKLNQGFGTLVRAGEPPLPPRALLPAPVIDKLPATLDKLSWAITWSEVIGATQYRVQLSDSSDFAVIRWQQLVDERQVSLPDLSDGTFYLRVRAIDSSSLEGMDAITEISQNAYPLAPQLQSEAGRRDMLIRWKPWAASDRYRVQLARDAEFRDIVSDSELSELQMTVAYSSEGPQYFRIKTLSDDGDGSFWSAIQEVPPLPDDAWLWALGSFLLTALIIF